MFFVFHFIFHFLLNMTTNTYKKRMDNIEIHLKGFVSIKNYELS